MLTSSNLYESLKLNNLEKEKYFEIQIMFTVP